MALLNFDASQVAPDSGVGDPLPPGWYNVMMDASEVKPTKDAATTGGQYLECRFSVLDGQFQGRKLFARFNTRNANPVAQEIGYKQLSAVCHAVGVLQVADSQMLHGKPLKVRVKIRKAEGDYEASNDITAYKNINEPTPGAGDAGVPVGVPAGFAAPTAAAPTGVPAGFAPQAWAQPAAAAPVAAPVAAPAAMPAAFPVAAQPVAAPPVAPVAAVAPPAALPPIKAMTAKANGATYESFIGAGWTDDKMVEHGYMTITQPTPPAVAPVAPVAPAAPAVPAAVPGAPATGPAAGAASLTPPWVKT
jgi:hypothetical protein